MSIGKAGFIGLLLVSAASQGQTKVEINPFGYDPTAYEAVPLHYTRSGRGDTTLLFIHGWNLNQTYWQPQVEAFTPRYQVVTLDLAGHGQSGRNRRNWTVESFATDIQSIIAREKLAKVILVAHSMGGEIALEVATRFPNPIIGIIGVDNFRDVTLSVTDQHRKRVEAYVKDFLAHYPDRARAMARELIVTSDTVIAQRIIGDYQGADPDIAVAVLMNVFPKAAQAKEKLPLLGFPLWIIMSDYAPYKEEGLRQYCRQGYRIVSLTNTGHFPMVERPQAFNQALRECLSAK